MTIISWIVMSVLTLFLPTLIIYWQYWKWTHRHMIQLAELIPGPPQLPVVGNAHIFMANPKDQLNIISDLIRDYGQYVKFWLGPELNIIVKNPADVKLLLTSKKLIEKGPVYKFMKTFIGPGLLSGGYTWKTHRKIVTPAYKKKTIGYYLNIFNNEAADLIKVLYNMEPNATFNIYDVVVRCTTQCVCQTLMGLSKDDSLNVKNLDRVIINTPRLYSLIFKKMTRWWLQIPIIYWLVRGKEKEIRYLNIIKELATDIVSKRRKVFENDENVTEETQGIVDRYIGSGELTKDEIIWATFSVFTTSQEASAKITAAVLLFLSQLPDWQEKVYNEIIEVLGPEDVDVTEHEVNQLPYLEMVFNEAIRFLPIAPLIQRTVKEEITINDGKITLPVGTSLVIPIHEMHRDPQYWEKPMKVMPDRFLPENVKKRDPNVFIPFSLGPMDCLGRVYAKTLIKIIVVRILRHMHLDPAGEPLDRLQLHIAISVKFAQGYNLRIRPRRLQQEENPLPD